jgi:hypothetical protein
MTEQTDPYRDNAGRKSAVMAEAVRTVSATKVRASPQHRAHPRAARRAIDPRVILLADWLLVSLGALDAVILPFESDTSYELPVQQRPLAAPFEGLGWLLGGGQARGEHISGSHPAGHGPALAT